MKRFLFFIFFTALVLPGMGQVNGPPKHVPGSIDMMVGVNFSGTTNWPPESTDFFGSGIYYRYFAISSPPWVLTNSFQFTIISSAPVQAAWILEHDADGSLTTITNLVMNDGPDVYYISRWWGLTTNQVRSLATGNWYVAVDFGDSNYLGHITPLWGQGPFISYPIIQDFHCLWGVYPISPNNRTAKVILDGSHCEDEFFLPVQCVWTAQAVNSPVPFTVTNLTATNVFSIGNHTVTVQLSDGVLTPEPVDLQFQVITAGQAVDWIIRGLPVNQLSPKSQKIMTTHLSAATA